MLPASRECFEFDRRVSLLCLSALLAEYLCALTDQGDDVCTASVQGPSVPDSHLSVGLELSLWRTEELLLLEVPPT